MASPGTDPATEPPLRVTATVVVAQRVRPGHEEEFRRWQDGVNRTVGSFAGFLGTEILAPESGQDEWKILYRFDSTDNLEAWLGSPAREALLERGSHLFAAPASQQVLVGEPGQNDVAVVVSHPVRPELEEEFLAWQRRMTDAERSFPGFRGSELFRPVPGVQDDWSIVYRYDSSEHLDSWLDSPERQRLLAEGSKFSDFELHRISNPFGSWFSFGEAAPGVEAPAAWKTALSVLVGLYPTVVLLTLAISELWTSADLWESLLLGNVLSVSLLTWVVMPVVTRALRFWLAPAPGTASRRVDVLGAVASIGFLTLAALVFWLVTTVIWTLP